MSERSFSSRRNEAFTFDVDGEEFTAVGRAPAGPLLDVAAARDTETRVRTMMDFLDAVLVPDSAERFARRLRDPVDPIDATTLMEVAEYLIERYSRRPTGPGGPSANGDSTTGPSLTVAALSSESIPPS